MNDFVVSSLKYRPKSFETVVGQNHVTGTLKNSIINLINALLETK